MNLTKYNEEIFENIKHIIEYDQEFWYARELQNVLEYTQWRRFKTAIERAKEACQASGNLVKELFADVGKMVSLGSGA